MTIVFPSNASLSERTNGLDERTIRRCVRRLVDAELISRRDSATRKRFPLRYDGEIRDAFGFDLAPMYQRETELKAWAQSINANAERLRSLRAKALALRVTALKQMQDVDSVTFLTKARNILRRATVKFQDIVDLIERMREMIGDKPCVPEFPAGNLSNDTALTDEMSGANGQSVRHVEAQRLNIKKEHPTAFRGDQNKASRRRAKPAAWTDFQNLTEFYPQEPHDTQSFLRTITDIGSLLKITPERLMCYLRIKGPGPLLLALDVIIGKAGEIRHPSSYFEKMMEST